MRPGITQQVTRLRAATNPYPGEGGEEEYGEPAGLLEFSAATAATISSRCFFTPLVWPGSLIIPEYW